jgi:4-amino-4-deoxy-L-arabinose transferase-like glycosyltransferase
MRRPAAQVAALIAATTAVKAVFSLQLEITSIESYLWLCAKHPALGYYDYPGLAAWTIGLSTAIFGESVLGVRLLTLLAGAATPAFVFLAGRRLYDEKVGRLAAFLTALVPLLFSFGSMAGADAPMLVFWAAALWALAHALNGDAPAWWYPAGVFLGLSMLGKYPAVLLGAGMLAFLALSPDRRAWLRRKEPYLAALAALAVFSPTIVWNAMNGWESFRYQGAGRFTERGFDPRKLLAFPASQLLLLTPFAGLWAWGSGLRTLARWRSSCWQDRFLAALSMTPLLFFAGVIFIRPVRGHWAAAGYLGGLLLAAAAAARGGPWGRRLLWGTAAVLGGAVLLGPLLLAFVPRERLRGWSVLASEVRKLDPQFVLAHDYHHASQMAYHLRPLPSFEFTPLGRSSKNFPHWWRPEGFAGKDAVIVFPPKDYPAGRTLAAACFERLEEPVTVEAPRLSLLGVGTPSERFLLVRARGYRPPSKVLPRGGARDE